MTAEPQPEELGMHELDEVDEPISAMAERHRRELYVHFYRMLRSFRVRRQSCAAAPILRPLIAGTRLAPGRGSY
jgi:hypothetical protein